MYNAVSQAILAHNILRADEKVDSSRIGITGISWGGVITSLAIGYDTPLCFCDSHLWKRLSGGSAFLYGPQFQY